MLHHCIYVNIGQGGYNYISLSCLMKSKFSLAPGLLLTLLFTQAAALACTPPFYELPYDSDSYCGKCDVTCSTCSGTSINSCSSCPADFTLNSTTSTCMAPSNSTVKGLVSLYHTYGFEKQSSWTAPSNTYDCNTITVIKGVAGDIVSVDHTLSHNYQVRILVSIWLFSGSTGITMSMKNKVTNGVVKSEVVTPTILANVTTSTFQPYCPSSKAINYQFQTLNTATSVTVSFTSTSALWGVRQYVLLQYLCSQPDCSTCVGPASSQCVLCNDANKKMYETTSGPCLCKYQNGYYAYPTGNSTYYCVNRCPNFLAIGQYYGDNITKACVLSCPAKSGAPQWNLTFASDRYGICVQTCDPYIELQTGVNTTVFYDKTNKKCVVKCPDSEPYSWWVDQACYADCPYYNSKQYYKFDSNMSCVDICPNITQGTTVAVPLYIDNTTNSCVTECDDAIGYWGYLDLSTGIRSCVFNCPHGHFRDLSSGRPLCTKVCPGPDWFGDFNALPPACVQTCSFGTYGDQMGADRYCVSKCNGSYYGLRTGDRTCIPVCPQGTWGQPYTMSCATSPYQCLTLNPSNPYTGNQTLTGSATFTPDVFSFADSYQRKCILAAAACKVGQFKENTTYMCLTSCPSGSYANNLTYWCVDRCYGNYFADNETNYCAMVCSPGYYADRGSVDGNKCVRNCNQSGGYPFRDDNNRQCVAICTAGYADKLAQSCVYTCTPPLYLNNSVPTELTCTGHCTSPYFAYNNTDSGICLTVCPEEPALFGDVVDGYRLCVEVCQMGTYGDQTTGSLRYCTAHCPNNTFAQNDTLRRCVTRCSDGTYGREADWTCVAPADCPENYTGDSTTNMCVLTCPISAGTFADNISKLCVSRCPANGSLVYYADEHSRWCILTCDVSFAEFGNNSTQTCEPKCLDRNSFADAQNTRRYCIDRCTWLGGVKYYRNNQTGVCVVSTGCTGTYSFSTTATYTQYYFADNSTLYCVQKCPNTTGVPSWGFLPTLTCVLLCYQSTYGDNSTGIPLCVSVCSDYPTPLWAYDGPGDKSVMLCMAVCPVPYFGQDYARTCVQNCPRQTATHNQTYAYDGTRRCLLTCPDDTWSDYITGVCFHYPVNCTAPCAYTNSSCSSYRWASDYNNSCVYLCESSPWDQFGDNLTQKCTDRCSVLSYADNETGTRICVERCPGEYTSSGDTTTVYDSYGDNNTQRCVRHCQEPGSFADWQLSLCLDRCMGDDTVNFVSTYANVFTKRCVISLYCPTYPDLYYGQNLTRTCQPACPLNTSYVSFADNITRKCIPQCYFFTNASIPLNTTFYGDTSTDRPVCVIACPTSPRLFGENVTNRCMAQCPDHEYGDQTGNRSCVPVCPNIGGVTWFSQLTERICVLTCENGTWGNYYNFIGPHCETVGTDCNVTYYGDNSTHMCVPLCPENMNYFGEPSTRLCTDRCPYLSNTTHTLFNATAGINLTEGRLFADYKTRLCVYTCPLDFGLQGTFGDNNTNTCVQRCPTGSYGDANTVNRFCVATCTGGAFADDLTMLCVDICPASPPTFGYEGNWTCLKTCPSGLWANSQTRKCQPACSPSFRLTLSSSTCVGVCPSEPDLYGDTVDYNCTAVCSNSQYADPSDRLCKASCSPLFQYNYRCVKYCPQGFFANVDNNCVVPTACNGSTYGDNATTKCVGTCPLGSFADPLSRFCIAVCPDDYYGDNKVCVQNCTTAGTVASNISQLCESICPNYTYGYLGECYPDCANDTYENDASHLCDTSCPTNQYADPVTHRCVLYCPTGYYRQKAGTNVGRCVAEVNGCAPYFADFVTGDCVAKCSSGYWGYMGNYTCNRACPDGSGQFGFESTTERTCYMPNNITGNPTLFGDSESGQFVAVCPQTPVITYGDVNRQLCVQVCQAFGGTDYFGDPATRRCESSCQNPTHYTADPATWLCTLRCTYGTFRDNSTNSHPICVTNCPSGYGDFTSRICVATCGQLTNTFGYHNLTSSYKVCLVQCPPTYYSQPLQRTCVLGCPGTLGVTTMYYAYNGTRECMTYCNDSFADPSNKICVSQCLSLTYPNADNSTNTCVYTCPDDPDLFADNHVCVHYCSGGTFADPKDRICKSRCQNMTGYNQYGDSRTGRCQANCSTGTWGDNSTNKCVSVCPPGSFADNSSGKCVAECPKDEQIYADMLLHVCAFTCSGGRFGSQINQTCIQVCDDGYYGDPTTTLCTDFCPVKIYSYGQNVTRTCVTSCVGWVGSDGVQGYADNHSRLCRDQCQMTLLVQTYADPTTKACVQRCPTSYFMENTTNVCVQHCPNGTFADNFTSFCVDLCQDNPESYGDTQLNICIYTCLRGQFSDNSTNLCVFKCPSTPDYYGDTHMGRCVFWCTEGTYAQNDTRRCLGVCPGSTYADNLTRRCVSDCPPSEWTFADDTTHRCVRICPLGYYAENTTQACQTGCWNYTLNLQSYADNISRFCVAQCPHGYFGDNTTHECVTQCSTTRDEYGHPIGRVCVARLDCYPDNSTGNLYFADSTSRQCVQKCPLTLWADYHIFVCMPSCNSSLPEFRNLHNQRCVWPCPSDPDEFADPSTGNCQRTCTAGTYAYTTNRTCQPSCLPFSLFADNSTHRCEPDCNTLPYFYADPLIYKCVYHCSGGYFADNRTQTCVEVCPVEWALFGQKHNYTCVSLCPDGEYADPLDDRICTSICSNSTFADSFTSSCVAHCKEIRPYWFEDTSTGNKVCVAVCPGQSYGYTVDQTCKYSSGTTLSTCPGDYYADKKSRLCVQFCPNGTYAHLPSKYCESACSGTYYADPVLRKCVNTCSPNLFKYQKDINTNLCVQYCPGGLYALNASTTNDSACVPTCYGMLALQSTWTCEGYCPSPFFGDWGQNLCRNNCTPNYAFLPNRTCLVQCEDPYYGNPLTFTCDLVCPLNYFGENTTRMCSPTCPNNSYADPSIRICVAQCPAHPSLYSDDRSNKCLPGCATPLFAFDPTRECVPSCPNITNGTAVFAYLADSYVRACVLQCNNELISFADFDNNICTKLCPWPYFADNYTKECVDVCPNVPNDTFSDNTSRICMEVCHEGSFGYQDTLNCVRDCWWPYFGDPTTNTCVVYCPDGYFADNSTATCTPQCPPNSYADPVTHRCLSHCPALQSYFDYAGNWTCLKSCPPGQYANSDLGQCVSICNSSAGMFAYSPTNLCVRECPIPYRGYLPNHICLLACPSIGYFYDVTINQCAVCHPKCYICLSYTSCTQCKPGYNLFNGNCELSCIPTTVITYADPSGVCVLTCPPNYYGNNVSYACVAAANCPVQQYGEPSTHLCTLCPSTCTACTSPTFCSACQSGATLAIDHMCYGNCNSTHIYSYNGACYNICPAGSYLTYTNVLCSACASICYTCFQSSTNCTSCQARYHYGTTCLSTCPSGYYGDAATLSCLNCTAAPSAACTQPLTYTTSYSVQNFQSVITLQFNQNVTLLKDLAQILNIRLVATRLLQIGTLVNNGVTYTYEILSNGTIKIYLNVGTSLAQPTFAIDISDPSAVITDGGVTLQNVQSLLSIYKVDYYSPSDGSEAGTNFPATLTSVIFLLLLVTTFFFSDVMIRPLQLLQLLFIHCLIDSPISANLYYLLSHLHPATLSFMKNWFSDSFPTPSPYYDTPLKIKDICTDYIFLRNVGQILVYIVVVLCFWFVFLLLGNKKVVTHKVWHSFFSQVSEKRFKNMLVNDVLTLFYVPITYFGFWQLKNLFGPGIYGFNGFATLFFLISALVIPIIWLALWYKRTPQEIHDTLWFLTLRIKQPEGETVAVHDDKSEQHLKSHSDGSVAGNVSDCKNPHQTQTLVFYLYLLLCSIWMVGLYTAVVAQLALLITTNTLYLFYLLKTRPYLNKLNLVFMVLFVLATITIEAFSIYFYQNDSQLFASAKTNIAFPFVVTLCVVLILMVLWALWRVVWEVSFFVNNFKRTLLYLEFADHDYVGEQEQSEKYSEYDKLAQKNEVGVGDILIEKVQDALNEDGVPVIKVTKKRMVKKAKAKGRKKAEIPITEEEHQNLDYVRVNQINVFDYKQEELSVPEKEPEVVVKKKRNIDDDIRDLISDQEEVQRKDPQEEEKKIDVEPGQIMLKDIDDLSNIDNYQSQEKQSEYPFADIEPQEEEEKKSDPLEEINHNEPYNFDQPEEVKEPQQNHPQPPGKEEYSKLKSSEMFSEKEKEEEPVRNESEEKKEFHPEPFDLQGEEPEEGRPKEEESVEEGKKSDNKEEKKVIKLEDLMEEEEGKKKKNLLFLFDDFEE